uniref:Arginine decarboxylase n=1 Tax=Chenopodium quinoa TaxID=63459 RepID=A0A803MEV4_CHEQI
MEEKFYRVDASTWHNSPPLVNTLKAVAEQNVASFLFPGHTQGQAIPSSMSQLIGHKPFLYDISEVDNLSTPKGPILEAQKQAADVFGASKTWFLVGGTTCGIHAAIMGACNPGDALILPRNSHISTISAMVFSELVTKYILPEYDFDWDISTVVSPSQVQKAIKELESEGLKPGAVFITSPTYHGICSNLNEISTLCHLHNIPLIVDEAHGAHFGFHPSLPSPALQQGADVVVLSTHKVLFSLTQSSMLHVSHNSTTLIDKEKIGKCISSLQTTSPSPLLLASLDATTHYLKQKSHTIFDNAINLATEVKQEIKQIPGYAVFDYPYMDPLRVTIGVFNLFFSGYEVDYFLYMDQKVVSELLGSRFITFPILPGTCKEHVDRLISGFKNFILSPTFIQRYHQRSHTLSHSVNKRVDFEPWSDIKMELTPRDAFFAKNKYVGIKDAIGKICGESICPFPPGVPIITPGEVVSERVVQILQRCKADSTTLVGASDPLLSSMLICDV